MRHSCMINLPGSIKTRTSSIQKVVKIPKGHVVIRAFLNDSWYVDQPQVWRQTVVNWRGVLGGGTAVGLKLGSQIEPMKKAFEKLLGN